MITLKGSVTNDILQGGVSDCMILKGLIFLFRSDEGYN